MAKSDKRSFNNADLSAIEVTTLKRKAVTQSRLQIRVSGKRFDLPVEAQLLQSDEKGTYAFISIQSLNAVLGLKTDGGYEVVNPNERDVAVKALKSVKAPSVGKAVAAEIVIPDDLKKALAKITPAGSRLEFGADGEYRFVKTRTKREPKSEAAPKTKKK